MAEQVNQRIEDMINELEQMRRTALYSDLEIREISRRRKEFEYHSQRRVKQKRDYTQYISYELALLEDISHRRKRANLGEKKKDIEYAIAKRVNKVFKQFIYRFQNDVDVYFEYLKFCKSVGFNSAASAIIGQMLQMHGDKPKLWQLASKWESEEQDNLDAARTFLLKGIQRHPEVELFYFELFKAELLELTFSAETEEDKKKILNRANIVWKNGLIHVNKVSLLFNCLDLVLKYDVQGDMKSSMMAEIWARKDQKEVLPYIAEKELEGCHWEEIEEFAEQITGYTKVVRNCIGVFEEALKQFPDENICTKYIYTLLGLNESVCEDFQKISAVKYAWWSGYKRDLLTNDMFEFGLQTLKLEGETSDEEMWKLLNEATERHSKYLCVWAEKLLLSKNDENKMMSLLEDAIKVLSKKDTLHLYNVMIDNIKSNAAFNKLLEKFQHCDNSVLISTKPRLLQKMYEYNGLEAARTLYNNLIRMPPLQLEVHTIMINLETTQENPVPKQIRRCYECAVLSHGADDADIWNDYVEFEIVTGNPKLAPAIYQRAVRTLQNDLVNVFVEKQYEGSKKNVRNTSTLNY